MELGTITNSLLGGILIGIAVTMMLYFNGRVTGISGIIYNLFAPFDKEGLWRWMFLLGLASGGFIMRIQFPDLFFNMSGRSQWITGVAGLLVGYGTVLGSGCTSGHGVCGISRFSMRSVAATGTFMFFGFLTVFLINYFFEGKI